MVCGVCLTMFLFGYMQANRQFTMGRYMLHVLILGELVNGLTFPVFLPGN